MGFTVTDKDGNVKSKTVFWGGMPIDVMTITSVDDVEPDETGVFVMTKTIGKDGATSLNANVIEMGTHAQACKVQELAAKYLAANRKRTQATLTQHRRQPTSASSPA